MQTMLIQLRISNLISCFERRKSMSVTQTAWRRPVVVLLLLVLSVMTIGAAAQETFPEVIELPNGFQPEGIASGQGTTFYVGSIPTGAVYRGDFKTGEGSILVPAQDPAPQDPEDLVNAIGLKYDPRSGLLFVAGGRTGSAFIYDGETGESIAEIQLTTLDSFINDVVITNDAAYFTNSFQRELYRVPLVRNGQLPDPPTAEVLPLEGEYEFMEGAFNANGIAAIPSGKLLIIVNSSEGALYTVDPGTGFATRISLEGGPVTNGDGLLLQGKTLYVVQNQLNQIAVIELAPDFTSGENVGTITSPLFDIPTTIAQFGKSLYAVNARFGTDPTPDTEYDVIRVPRK
jgi:sugar lactone lactonase YvrE